MNNYFKLYIRKTQGTWERINIKTIEEVKKNLKKAQREGYERYLVIKRINGNTDIPVAHGFFSKECKVVEVEGLDVDWRVVGQNVVNYPKYIEAKKKEEEER